jgi:tRNA(Ile)-lysidine synthase
MDMERISFPLLIRHPLPGDRFTPLGMTGTQKVSRFFINRKVTVGIRRKSAVLLSRGQIIWVMGYRIEDGVKVSSQTENILKMELLLA